MSNTMKKSNTSRKCARCKTEKSLDMFYTNNSYCKRCVKLYAKERSDAKKMEVLNVIKSMISNGDIDLDKV